MTVDWRIFSKILSPFFQYLLLSFLDVLVEAASAIGKAKNDNNYSRQTVEQKNCDLDTCSISTTVPCTRGSRASSHISIPGLDWDSQVN